MAWMRGMEAQALLIVRLIKEQIWKICSKHKDAGIYSLMFCIEGRSNVLLYYDGSRRENIREELTDSSFFSKLVSVNLALIMVLDLALWLDLKEVLWNRRCMER